MSIVGNKYGLEIQMIEVVDFILKTSDVIKQQKDSDIEFAISVEFSSNDKNEILSTTKIGLFDEEGAKVGVVKLNQLYSHDIEDLDLGEEKPHEILEIVNRLSISTARGYLASLLSGTALHDAYLPLVADAELM